MLFDDSYDRMLVSHSSGCTDQLVFSVYDIEVLCVSSSGAESTYQRISDTGHSFGDIVLVTRFLFFAEVYLLLVLGSYRAEWAWRTYGFSTHRATNATVELSVFHHSY